MGRMEPRIGMAALAAWMLGAPPSFPDAALFDLAGEGYRLTVGQGAAGLVDLGSHVALEVSAQPDQAATVRLLAPEGVFWDLRDDAFISLDIENMGGEEAAFRKWTMVALLALMNAAHGARSI